MSKSRRAIRCEKTMEFTRPRRRPTAQVVPSEDAHCSEYVADCDKRRAFLTGFTGSAGLAVVTATQALLWTDSRYWLQAQKQLAGAMHGPNP